MKTKISIESEMTDEQCDALLSHLTQGAEWIGIKLEIESNKLISETNQIQKTYNSSRQGIALKEQEAYQWMKSKGYDRRACKDVASILAMYLIENSPE